MTTDAIAPIGATPFAGLLPWLSSLAKQLRTAVLGRTATNEERELLSLIEFAAVRFGGELLRAESLDDLDERLDELVGSPDAIHCTALLARLVPVANISEPVSTEDFADAVRERLGDAQVRLLVQSKRVIDAWLDAQLQVVALIAHEPPIESERIFAFSLASADIPTDAAEIIFNGLRASFCVLAIAQAMSTEQKVEPWLARALVECLVVSATTHLRMLASIPGVTVDEAIVPPSAKLDLNAIERRHERVRAAARRGLPDARRRLGL
ncbi:MAG: hypothetical protein KF773_03310 [Deltaproteobacteria bacterium]|nr:hypothetical protein [Deltaproteobacteria bacterium]